MTVEIIQFSIGSPEQGGQVIMSKQGYINRKQSRKHQKSEIQDKCTTTLIKRLLRVAQHF